MIERKELVHYLTVNGSTVRVGEGFTEFTENKNPRSYERQYLGETDTRSDVVGYAPSITYAFEVGGNDSACNALFALSSGSYRGENARVSVVTVFTWQKNANGLCQAVRRTYSVHPTKLGDSFDAVICAGTLKACGNEERGTFDMATSTFTVGSEG